MRISRRYLRRYRQIAEVLVRHGFGAFVVQLGLDRTLDLRGVFGPAPEEPVSRKTAAIHFREALEELGPTFIKAGQIASTRPEFLPPEFINELANLQDNVPPTAWDQSQAVIEAELGAPVASLFLAIDPTPLASASLGQVHAALLSDRTEVIIKVQRPGIEATIETDLAIIQDLAALAAQRIQRARAYDPIGLAQEFADALRGELDYRREGRNADRFRANFAGETYVLAPQVYWQYTSRRVMVQERLHGIKVDDYTALAAAGYDRDRIVLTLAHMAIKEVMEDGFFHADPHPGNILVLSGEIIGLIDFGTVGTLDRTDRVNLIRLYIALIQFDAESAVDQLIGMGIADATVDRAGLIRVLRRLLRKYYGLPLRDISAAGLVTEVEPIIYEYGLHVPSDYWLLIKTLVIFEGVGKELSPGFDIFAVSGPYVRRFLIQLALPSFWGPMIARGAGGWINLLTMLPRQATKILGQLERGGLELQVQVPAVEEGSRQVNRAANRIVMSILLAALIVALAPLLPTLNGVRWPWGVGTWLIVLGCASTIILAFWLIVAIWRSNGRR